MQRDRKALRYGGVAQRPNSMTKIQLLWQVTKTGGHGPLPPPPTFHTYVYVHMYYLGKLQSVHSVPL